MKNYVLRMLRFYSESRVAMGPYPLSKLNALGLSARKWTKLLMMIFQGRVKGSYRLHSITMCLRVWMSASPHEYSVESWEKNLCLYSPIGVCPVVMHVKRAHRELVNPIKGSYELPLAYIGLMTFCSSSSKLRKYWPFFILSANDVCYS